MIGRLIFCFSSSAAVSFIADCNGDVGSWFEFSLKFEKI